MTLSALFALAACGTDSGSGSVSDAGKGGGRNSPPPESGEAVPLSGGTWQVDSITTGGEKVPGVPGKTTFSLDVRKGTVGGGTGCNAYGGMFRFEDGGIVVDQGFHTLIACEDRVMRAEKALHKVFQGKLVVRGTESAATLTGAGGGTIALTRTATPRRLPPAPLTGTKWTVVGLTSGSAIDGLPPGAGGEAHLTIGADGTATGRLGCNTFRTTAKVAGETVTFGRLALTRMMCAGEAGKLERALQEALKGKTAFHLQEGQLSLTAQSGKGLTAARA